MKHDFSPSLLRKSIDRLNDLELARVRYCYQVGSTFVAAALMEDAVIAAMLTCDRVKVSTVLGMDVANWQRLIKKQEHLRGSTLGSLINILSKHGILASDLSYLRWLKEKRDFFIHRHFHDGSWPGDVYEHQIEFLCRRLGAWEIVFQRASHRVWGVFGRAGLMTIETIPGSGALVFNPDFLTSLATESSHDRS